MPDARLACLNVLKSSLLTIDNSLDESGHSIHVQRLVQLKDWGRTLDLAPDRVSYHVLEALDAGAAILEYVNANRVDHIVLGARTDSPLAQHPGQRIGRDRAEGAVHRDGGAAAAQPHCRGCRDGQGDRDGGMKNGPPGGGGPWLRAAWTVQ